MENFLLRLVRTISPAIYPRNQGNVANGELPASPVPAAFIPTICPRNQGHLDNGERFPSPGSGCQQLEEVHHVLDRWAMEQWRMGKALDAEFADLGS